jgi:hypothetical protein
MAGKAFGHDYKTESLEQEALRQSNSVENWIYVGTDIHRPDIAKIGLTRGRLGTRATGSQNPFFTLLCAFKIKEGVASEKVSAIESAVIGDLSTSYERVRHVTTGRHSEWFRVAPNEMRERVYDFLYKTFIREMYCYHCDLREVGVIYSWENTNILKGSARAPYRAQDLSSPPIDPNCYMPGGCGADCNCWK